MTYQECYTDEQLRNISREFHRLKDDTYLDHAATTLYSERYLKHTFDDLHRNLYGNPHSLNTPSTKTSEIIDRIREEILRHFHTSSNEYTVIFTGGATGALKLLAESFAKDKDSSIVYLQDNHTSVLGMRKYFQKSTCIRIGDFDSFTEHPRTQRGLFVYPLQSNFSGRKYPSDLIARLKPSKTAWFSALDAATYVMTNPLNLTVTRPDFVAISFSKIFGYPSGLGALLVKNTSAHALEKQYFGGGTVQIAMSTRDFQVYRENLSERFEDGTIPFLSIIALKHAFDGLNRIDLTMNLISEHVFNLADYVYRTLLSYRHFNGDKCVEIFKDGDSVEWNRTNFGGILAFLPRKVGGAFVGFNEVLHMANLHGIHLRTGCFCNPGACQWHLKLTDDQVRDHFELGHVCGDRIDLLNGTPTGAVRISFGYMSTKADADRFLSFFRASFVIHNSDRNAIRHENAPSNSSVLRKIYIYPIKSCAAVEVDDWRLDACGLVYDRTWMIVDAYGTCLTQKRQPLMALLRPRINVNTGELILTFKGHPDISIDLDEPMQSEATTANICQSRVCRDQVHGLDCGLKVSQWLSRVFNQPGLKLFRKFTRKSLTNSSNDAQLSLSNEAQFLLVNASSVKWLINEIETDDLVQNEGVATSTLRFRPNLVVDGDVLAENSWTRLEINGVGFKCTKLCTRCQMICIDPRTGAKTVEPYRTISRKFSGKVQFGVYLQMEAVTDKMGLKIGSELKILA